MNFRQKLVRRRNIAIRDTIIGALLTGYVAYLMVSQDMLWVIGVTWFSAMTLSAAVDIVRKTRGIRMYDARPEVAYLVEIREMFGVAGK